MDQRRWWRSPVLLAYLAALALYLLLAILHGDPEPAMLIGLAIGLGGGWLLGYLSRGTARDIFSPLGAAIQGQRPWLKPDVLLAAGVIGAVTVGLLVTFPADAATTTGLLAAWPFGNEYGMRRRTPV